MSSVPEAPLERLTHEVDPGTVVEFVAGLLEARGFDVTRRGDRRIAATADGRTVRYAVVHPADGPAPGVADVDRVIVVGDPPAGADDWDAEVVATPVLGRQLAYAVDRDVALGLLATHFGWSPADEPGTEAGGTDGAGQSRPGAFGPTDGAVRWRAVALVLLVAGLLAGSAVALSGVGDVPDTGPTTADGSIGSTTDGTGESTPPGDGVQTRTDRPPDTTAVEGTPASPTAGVRVGRGPGTNRQASYADAPPGIAGPDRIYVHQLAGAFWERLDNRSYRLSLTYRELEDGRTRGSYTETLRVETNARYRVSTSRIGTLEAGPLSIAGTDLYANGTVRYARDGTRTVERRTTTYDPFMVNATQYVGWFFSARNSTIDDTRTEGNTTTYHVLTSGDPDPRFEDVRGSALVTERGLVTAGRWTYTPADHPDLRAVFEMRVTDVGSTRVTAPEWAPEG
jgi:hypothetical protein